MTDTSDMEPEGLTAEIGKTREDLGATVAALDAKTDVRTRARAASKRTVAEFRDTASSAVDNVKDAAHRTQDKFAGGPAVIAREAVSDKDMRDMAMRTMPWVLVGAVVGAVAVVWMNWRRRS
jgi:hypothetical protein